MKSRAERAGVEEAREGVGGGELSQSVGIMADETAEERKGHSRRHGDVCIRAEVGRNLPPDLGQGDLTKLAHTK